MSTQSTANQPPNPPGFRILLVDDDMVDAYLIARALSDNPAVGEVVHARSGSEALEMVERGEIAPDLAFIDLNMPLMNGFDVLFALAGRADAHFPLVVLTSSSSPTDAIRSRLRSAVRVVTKPDTVAEMYAVLKTTIEAICPTHPRAKPAKTPSYLLMTSRAPGLRRAAEPGGTTTARHGGPTIPTRGE